MHKRFAQSLLVFLGVFLTAACGDTQLFHTNMDEAGVSDDDFVESTEPLAAADLDGLWERSQQVIEGEGYMVDSGRSKYAEREMLSHWNAVLGMNRYEGYRTRIWIRYHKSGKDQWKVAVQVQRQRNTDIKRPSEISMAKWEAQPADKERSGVVLWKIESGFRVPGADDAKSTDKPTK
jgi:hypothetical protein